MQNSSAGRKKKKKQLKGTSAYVWLTLGKDSFRCSPRWEAARQPGLPEPLKTSAGLNPLPSLRHGCSRPNPTERAARTNP